MFDYEWGASEEPDPNPQIFDQYATTTANQLSLNETLVSLQTNNGFSHQNHHFHNPNQAQPHAELHSLYDTRAYSGVSAYSTLNTSRLSLDPLSGAGGSYFLFPKTEDNVSSKVDFTSRIGLNLGVRTYFSFTEDEFVNRLYRCSRPGDPGSIINIPRCQAEGCNANLTHAKHYHRRHKVCEFHSKSSTVVAAGLTQRFCQQCSRFHRLSEFDNGKRSCRKRLADHNRRRRKSQRQQNHKLEIGGNSSSDNPLAPRSPPDCRVQACSSSVSVAVSSPLRMSLDCFRQRPYNPTPSSSSSARTGYFSNG